MAWRLLVITLPVVAMLATTPVARADELGQVRGVVRAEAVSTLSSELVARVMQLPYQAGQSFRIGDILVAFDCRRYEADLRAAQADAKAARVTVQQNKRLFRNGAAGRSDFVIAQARHEKSQALVDSLNVRLSQCRILAPFGGRVSERFVNVFELPSPNTPLLKIVKDGQLEADLVVPSKWMTWLRPGLSFRFIIDETGTEHTAVITYLGAVVDPVSRTTSVTARLEETGQLVRPGMSGKALLSPPKGMVGQ